MDCRPGCGACCIGPFNLFPHPRHANGKPAGVRCVQLTPDNRCALFGGPERPKVCLRLKPSIEMCGQTREEAMVFLAELELVTNLA